MSNVERTRNEYGGFLPLELNPGREMFSKYGSSVSRFNSVKAALDFAVNALKCKQIKIPYYYCPSTTEAIKRMGIKVDFYHINENLVPEDYIADETGNIVLLVDYFGVRTKEIDILCKSYKNSEVIVDRAHAFFTEPVMEENVHNIYSAKKFLGIPDGAYLISNMIRKELEIPIDACQYAEYLMKAYERGTNAAYKEKKEVDRVIASNYASMSKLALGLLKNVDYDRVQRQRKNNYEFLRYFFRDINELHLPENAAAYLFPLLISRKGSIIKQTIIKEKIYAPTLWLGEDLLKKGNEFELNISSNAVFLPIDQRYDIEDMKYIAGRVQENINKLI